MDRKSAQLVIAVIVVNAAAVFTFAQQDAIVRQRSAELRAASSTSPRRPGACAASRHPSAPHEGLPASRWPPALTRGHVYTGYLRIRSRRVP